MKRFSHVLSISVLTCALFAISSPPVLACGPSFVLPVFTMNARPEQFDNYAKGNVGIIQPKFNRSTLFVAYREFNNLPFSDKEQADLVRNWLAEYENQDTNEATKDAAINSWITARKKIASGAEPKIYTDRTNPETYSSFYNCTVGAFDNAVKTLEARLEKAKADDANVQEWLRGQDQVFANCSEVKDMPSAVAADAPDWLKQDRDYQIAAAHFYATQYDEAKTGFEQIAKNTASPWRDISAYLLARVFIRQASAISEDQAQHDKMLAYYKQAEDQLNSVLADTSLASVHDAAKSLLNLISFRLHPEILHDQLVKKLTDKAENPRLFQDVTDYRRLLDKASHSIYDEVTEQEKILNAKYRQNNELTDWIFTVQSTEPDAYKYALEKWQANKNVAWLVTSLMKANSDSPEVSKLIEASKAIDKTSAAFLTANYHVVRLQTALGQADDARKTLDAILSDKATLNTSARNQFLSERLLVAQDLHEFIKFAQRQAVVFAYDQSEFLLVDVNAAPKDGEEDYTKNERAWAKRVMFDEDATRIMNTTMPLSVLKQMALNTDLPDYLRSQVALSAWVRAVLLTDDKTALEIAPELGKLIPELKTMMASYGKAKEGKARTYEAVWAMLKNPATRPLVDYGIGRQAAFSEIENYRDNWWCDRSYLNYGDDKPKQTDMPTPVFLTKEDIAQATKENAQMDKIAISGSNFLAANAIEWAEFAPKDKRLPEVLALAVKSTRYGCQNCDTAKVSKGAFDILKDRFGNTEWKKKTPYWFKDEGCETAK